MPSGRWRRTSSAPAVPGTTVTRQPAVARQRRMLPLRAIVDGDDVADGRGLPAVSLPQGPHGFVPRMRLPAHDFLRQVHAFEAGPLVGHELQRQRIDVFVRRIDQRALRRSAIADAPGEPPRIDARDGHQVAHFQPGVQVFRRPPVGGIGNGLAQDTAADRRRGRFNVFRVDADIADVGKRERNDLARVGRIGQDFLIARNGRVEADLAHGHALGAGTLPPVDGSVFEDECRIRRRRAAGRARRAGASGGWLYMAVGAMEHRSPDQPGAETIATLEGN